MSIQIRVEGHSRGCASAYINRYETSTGLFHAAIVWHSIGEGDEIKHPNIHNTYYGLEATGKSSDEAYIALAEKIKLKNKELYGNLNAK